ncbi:Pre-mRNA splicing factor PRP21 like protein-domain-containing protein, partial [Lineolata rhizophorae]
LDSVPKPPEGVPIPPREIRKYIERTAGYVVRNGKVFEDRVRDQNAKNAKFSFLRANDEYHAYYSWRVEEIRAGRGTDVSAGHDRGSGGGVVGQYAMTNAEEESKGPPAPPEFEFSARMPPIHPLDQQVILITARHAAKHGRSFITQLSQREANNPQFDFLRPNHSLYQYYTRMVDQYASIINGATADDGKVQRERIARLQEDSKNWLGVVDRAKQRAEYNKHVQSQREEEEKKREEERIAYAQIDWHDFDVLDTVTFGAVDQTMDMPPPPTLQELQSLSLEEKWKRAADPGVQRIEEAMPDVEMMDAPTYGYEQQPITPATATPTPQPTAPPSATPQPVATHHKSAAEEEEEQRIRERAEARERAAQAQAAAKGAGPMRIKSDYVPRAQAKRQAANTAMCPNCKMQIPYDELEAHMKSNAMLMGAPPTTPTVELIDPRWKEQREKADARHATTNLSTSDVANNLKRLASQRTDVFDPVTGQTLSEDEQARRKRLAS